MTDDDVNPMFRSKVDAASVLHKLSLTTPVRRFVLFSSITGLLGSRAVAPLHGGQRLRRYVRLRAPRAGPCRRRSSTGACGSRGRMRSRR